MSDPPRQPDEPSTAQSRSRHQRRCNAPLACPLEYVNAGVVMMFMERKAGKPDAANNRKKYLSAMFGWAVKKRYMTANPARDAERESYATDGFHTWSVEEVRQFEERHPIGTKARLALAYCRSPVPDAATW